MVLNLYYILPDGSHGLDMTFDLKLSYTSPNSQPMAVHFVFCFSSKKNIQIFNDNIQGMKLIIC